MRAIKPLEIKQAEVAVPGSKSYTHRMLIAAALSDGRCVIRNGLTSEDTLFTLDALKKLGICIEKGDGRWVVHGRKGELNPYAGRLYLGNSGTSMRLLTALVALGQGRYTLTGTERMQKRPIRDLIEGLLQLGIKGRSVNGNGCPPVQIIAQPVGGGRIHLNCSVSSQYLSALLLIAPYARQGIEIRVSQGPVSRPYVDITLDVMQKFGVGVERCNYEWFNVRGSQRYHAGEYFVEPDCSQAGYFWAAAAITGAGIKVKDVWPESCQGDIGFIELLEIMGCRVYRESDGITVTGDSLSAVEADMADLPDMVPTLAVVAAFAKGTTVIRNVAHLKVKESDRLAALRNELARVGIETRLDDGNLLIRGGRPHGAQIKTYGDHRIAMSFALVGLKTAGIVIEDETCVEKSFPNFWQVLEKLYDCD